MEGRKREEKGSRLREGKRGDEGEGEEEELKERGKERKGRGGKRDYRGGSRGEREGRS